LVTHQSQVDRDDASDEVNQSHAATRITIRPQDSSTGEEIEKEEVGMGYERRPS
jgi:hypothetical protein